jgi:protein phosphatase
MNIRPGLELANLSDVGCHRTENEDNFCYAEPESDEELLLRGRLIVVADGMGGHEGGQVASGLAVHTVWDLFLHGPARPPLDTLMDAYQAAHAAIQQHALLHPELTGMGTTCTTAIVREDRLFYGHVGDSRLYLLRGDTITRVTRDHSYIQKMLDNGTITPEEAKDHPSKNVLTSALGSSSPVEADFAEAPSPLEPSDILLLCTDGLHGLLSEEELLAIASQNPPSEACRQLVETAKSRGGYDNITVQILRIKETPIARGPDPADTGN